VLARPFRDGGVNLAGVFIDKYQVCNVRPDGSGTPNTTSGNPADDMLAGGVAASRPLQWPVCMSANGAIFNSGGGPDPGTTAYNSGANAVNSTAIFNAGTPSASIFGVWSLCRTRGRTFSPIAVWTRAHLGFLALAHAQALLDTSGVPISGATTPAAWMDVAPYAPKGSNNNGSDINKPSLTFSRLEIAGTRNINGFAGRYQRAFTGAAKIGTTPAVEHTTHNGQLSGVVDVNGNQWDVCPGLVNTNGTIDGFGVWPEQISWNLCSSQNDIVGNGQGLTNNSLNGDTGVWWPTNSDSSPYSAFVRYLVANSAGTWHPTAGSTPTQRALAECGIPRFNGTSSTHTSTNVFGGDSFYHSYLGNLSFIRSSFNLMPRFGGSWGTTIYSRDNNNNGGYIGGSQSPAGIFAINISEPLDIGHSNEGRGSFATGARAQRLLAT